ncbi:MAG TPA: carbohydrate ABC transporter permease [Thermomicrobiales bacterium]|nr:carbohydrate ABC transporter permease [Thermomicrobiales bacterium]
MRPANLLRHGIMLILGAIWIIPLYFVLINAVTPPAEYRKKELYAPPSSFALGDNISTAWNAAKLGVSVGSTFFYATVGAAAAVLLAAMAAYAIIGLRIRHGFFWFMVLYAGTIFPFQMYLSPLYSNYVRFNLYDKRIGLLLLYTAIAIPFGVFVIRNHFTSIPYELPEAARIDGASSIRIFGQIYSPLSLNAFATVFILQFTWIWNDLLFGLTLSRSADVRPIMTALAGLQGQYASASIPVVLAGALIVSVPTFVLFFAVQRVFVRGLGATTQ